VEAVATTVRVGLDPGDGSMTHEHANDMLVTIGAVQPGSYRYAWVKLLWRKVIVRAIYDYVLWKDISKVRKKHDAQDAARWLFEESDLNNSLEQVCLVADVDIGKIRSYAKTATKDQVKKLEHIERDRVRCPPVVLELEPDDDGDDF
jgi:hypothetical protein